MELLRHAIVTACQQLFAVDVQPILTRPDTEHGDFATNVALQIAKGLERNPRDVADELAEQLRQDVTALVSEVSVAGPGFINFRLQDHVILEQLSEATDPQELLKGTTVLVEYSDPNPFKPLHAGHLYTTVVGNTIARLVSRSGAKVVRLNYGGDVGLHVGKAMWAIIRELGGESPEKLSDIAADRRPTWLGERYVAGNTAYEEDEASKQEVVAINKRVYELHATNDHESPFAQVYWTCRQWSYDYFTSLYDQLQIDPFDRFIPESEVTPLGLKTVETQLATGVFKNSDGAIIYDGEAKGLHTRVFVNSAGLPTYEAKELGLIQTKWNDYHYDKSIVITANEQDQYMQVILAAVSEFESELASRTQHITHGVLKLVGGVKMSSRKGGVITAQDIIEAARQAADVQSKGANEDTVLAAIKYAFIKNRIGGDIIYDPAESVALEGNSGPYLQYAHARGCAILRKAPTAEQSGSLTTLEKGERELAVKLSEYKEIVSRATLDLMPHSICTYLYELAQVFNRFYEHNRVIGDPRENARLELVISYTAVLKDGLSLLGITAPETM